MDRRRLLQGALAASITRDAAAMRRLVAPNASRDLLAPLVASHLDLAAAQREYVEIREALRDVVPPFVIVLDLVRYETAASAALRLLGSLPVGWTDLGMRSLGLATARQLALWRTRAFRFPELHELTADEAWALVSPAARSHALHFEMLDSLDVEAARGLVAAAAGSSLCVKLAHVSNAAVRELARHDHELFVGLRHGWLDEPAQQMLDEQDRRYRSQFDLRASIPQE